MGAQVQYNSYLPGYYSMRDLDEDSSGGSLPIYYGDKSLFNGQYYNGFLPRTTPDSYLRYDKDAVKQKMLEHEATFKSQVHELHRLYRIQRDLTEEIKRKELDKHHRTAETSLLSSPLASEHSGNWHVPQFPLANCTTTRQPMMGNVDSNPQLSFLNGKTPQAQLNTSQDVGSSKDCEIIECRPSKFRRKMFDLQLPADDCVDTEEERPGDKKLFSLFRNPSSSCHSAAPSYAVKDVLRSTGTNDCLGITLRSDNCFRNGNGLADLNEPVQVEETNSPASLGFLGHSISHKDSHGQETFAPNSQFLGLSKEPLQNLHYGIVDEKSCDLNVRHKETERRWISHMLDSRESKSNGASYSQGFSSEKNQFPSQSFQAMPNKAQESQSCFQTDQSREEYCEEGTRGGLRAFNRNHNFSNYKLLESNMAPHVSNPYPYVPSSELPKLWSYSSSTSEKLTSSMSHKSISVHAQPCFNSPVTLTQSSQSSTQSPGMYGSKQHGPSGFGNEIRNNGFYYGSPSRSKELPPRFPSVGCDYQTCRNADNVPSKYVMDHDQKNCRENLNCIDLDPSQGINLNVMLSNSSSDEAVPQLKADPLAVLPWLKPKPAVKDERSCARRDEDTKESSLSQVSSNQFSNKIDHGKGCTKSFAEIIASDPHARNGDSKVVDTCGTKKILGFPIFGKPYAVKDSSCQTLSASPPFKHAAAENIQKPRGFDMNLPCESSPIDLDKESATETLISERAETNIASSRKNIDLNSCLTEDDASITTSGPICDVKVGRGIDLEAPIPEFEEESPLGLEPIEDNLKTANAAKLQEGECSGDERVTVAAEAIVTISSIGLSNQVENSSCGSLDTSLDTLHWFVDVISSCANDLELKSSAVLSDKDAQDKEKSNSDEVDYFEFMTLKLTETNLEEYWLNLPVEENPKVEEETGAPMVTSRPRKGQARRGRQRRDFQRDILPGLTSLSRHEVSEDLQTFGGMMKATGHSWEGLTRRATTRNGSARGRRRLAARAAAIADPNPVCTPLPNGTEVALEDRNLTGWGKTTRRPRRQRCPAGTPSIPMS